jgi:uncharacterized protein with ParB-like and HNH nuclease domain
MLKHFLDTKTISFNELLSNGNIYKIPDFQRDYSWKEEHWEDLWNDIIELAETDIPHYMGNIVLQTTTEDDIFIIVDGQQRITTLSIFVLAIIGFLKQLIHQQIEIENNEARIEIFRNQFIGKKTASSLFYFSKLSLNENNDNFYQSRILLLKEPINYRKLRDSEKLLYDAYKYFFKKLNKKFNQDNGVEISNFLEKLVAKKLIFIQITVDDDLNAYTVFETLNARGIELTTTDLLKNYLFSLAAQDSQELNILKERWKAIIDTVGLQSVPVFLYYYLNTQYSLIRKERLFKEIKKQITNGEKVFNLLEELEKKAYLFTALQTPHDEFWNENSQKNEIIKSLEELKLFNTYQHIPLLFSVYDKLKKYFPTILKMCVVISFRYNIIGRLNPNNMEKIYNDAANGVFNAKLTTPKDIFHILKDIYINDEEFTNNFSIKIISTKQNKKIVKYILTKIENQLTEKDNDFNDANFTIEHILPEKFDENWNQEFNSEAENFVYRLGNYTLLESKKNNQCANKTFSEKNNIYQNSQYQLTRKNLHYDVWNIAALNKYQQQLAKYAKKIWKII